MLTVRGAVRGTAALVVASAAIAGLGACRQPSDRTVVAVLGLGAQSGSAAFAERVVSRCPDCVIADDYAGSTGADVRAAVADGADVIVARATSAVAGAEVVDAAGSIPVVAVDVLIDDAAWYVGFDRTSAGVAVADAMSRQLGDRGGALLLGGSAVDRDTDVIESGLRDGLTGHGVDVLAELDATTATADEARDWVAEQLEGPGGKQVAAVVAASDAQALGVLEAFEAAGLPRPWPLVAGIGGDLEAVRRVVAGDQTFTVHVPVTQTAQRAADVALSFASADPGADLTDSTELSGVPAYVFEPVVVSVGSVTDTVVRDGTYTTEEICAGDLEEACADLGIR
ncbi:substrate-binding domain-containing protein [Nocardioides bigeumensis]|uniref:Periplasmic binding protein domain-containing protein n=1 Tax=Nocardioides bigeumensis TaxID=433657 RepID=A0ABN2XZJ4_9ACTN